MSTTTNTWGFVLNYVHQSTALVARIKMPLPWKVTAEVQPLGKLENLLMKWYR